MVRVAPAATVSVLGVVKVNVGVGTVVVKPLKPVRRKVVQCHAPTAINGMWVRLVKLSCGHEQQMARSDYSRTGRTIVCHRCSEPRK